MDGIDFRITNLFDEFSDTSSVFQLLSNVPADRVGYSRNILSSNCQRDRRTLDQSRICTPSILSKILRAWLLMELHTEKTFFIEIICNDFKISSILLNSIFRSKNYRYLKKFIRWFAKQFRWNWAEISIEVWMEILWEIYVWNVLK